VRATARDPHDAETGSYQMSENNQDRAARRTVIGGRHGSPTVTVALPFAKITNVDAELRDTVAELAALVARVAANSPAGDEAEADLLRVATQELADRLSGQPG
jgi:hypothetical protein